MRTLSFVLAFTAMLAGPSMTVTAEGAMPGAGSFSYGGSPVSDTPTTLAHLTLTRRS